MCIADFVKNINLKVFNLMSRANQKRYIKLHESCKCKYRSDASVVTINNVGMKVNTGVNVKN